jgi:predicted mannosyl-3-phosphoglycerate phosphatase (HAD superfamily)
LSAPLPTPTLRVVCGFPETASDISSAPVSAGADDAAEKAKLVESSATLTELSKLPGTISKDADKVAAKASSAMITGKAETEAALAKATAQAEAVFAKSKDEGRAMLANAQSGLEAAQVSHISMTWSNVPERSVH